MFLFGFGLPIFARSTNNALPPLAPPHGELPPTFWEQHVAAMLVSGIALLLVAGMILWLFLKTKPQPVVPPADTARAALAGLQQQPEDGKTLSEISQVLRRYVAAAFEFTPGEMTTTEFSAALTGQPEISGELARSISDFLRECDERKFSPALTSGSLGAASRALELIADLEAVKSKREMPCPVK